MESQEKSREELVNEATGMRRRIAELEALEAERKQTYEELLKERDLLRILIDNLPMLTYVKDTESRVILTNVANVRLFGRERPEEIIGKTDFDFFPKELAEGYYADEQEIFRTGEPLLNREEPFANQTTGEKGWLSTTKVPFFDQEGNIVGLVGIGLDITERRQAQEALQRARDDLERRVEERTAELAEANTRLREQITEREQADVERARLQEEIIEMQRQALQELSTPIIPVVEGIIVIPLIGNIDTGRARDITRALLAGISTHRAKAVIIDITGVPMVDSGVADHLNKTIQAARLKGARAVVTGISDAVAETVVGLGIDWSGVDTLRDLQTGLAVALDSLGMAL